jgi:hypothetical protein
MAERTQAKKYLRSIQWASIPATEADCVAALIVEHRRQTQSIRYRSLSWFGRMLWKFFGAWL